MIDAIVGSVIMVVATTSLALAIELTETAFRQSGYHPLSPSEVNLVNDLYRRTDFSLDAEGFESSNSALFKD